MFPCRSSSYKSRPNSYTTPELVKVTALPLPPPAATTVKLVLYAAVAGGVVVNVMVCATRLADTVFVTCVAGA